MAELERSGEFAGPIEKPPRTPNLYDGPVSKDQLFNIRQVWSRGQADAPRLSSPINSGHDQSARRLPHLEHASRSRQSGMVVSGTIALGHFDRVGLDLVAAMLAAGSLPDVIGDVHGLSINGPAFDQPVRLAEYFDSSGAGREIGTRFRSGACSRCVPHRDDLRLILFNNNEV
jgi:hypothetical protein